MAALLSTLQGDILDLHNHFHGVDAMEILETHPTPLAIST